MSALHSLPPTLTCHPLFRGGYQILADGRPLKCVKTRREAVAYCAAHNVPDRKEQEDAAWAAHGRAA